MKSDLKAAYALISNFKRGAMAPGTEVSNGQMRLLRLLSKDLQVPVEGIPFERLVYQIAHADTHWNHRSAATIDLIYAARENGDAAKAETIRSTFIEECPSVWYRDVIGAL